MDILRVDGQETGPRSSIREDVILWVKAKRGLSSKESFDNLFRKNSRSMPDDDAHESVLLKFKKITRFHEVPAKKKKKKTIHVATSEFLDEIPLNSSNRCFSIRLSIIEDANTTRKLLKW